MTWASTISTGSGSIRARLQVEGVAVEAVTHPDMVGPSFDQSAGLLGAPGTETWSTADGVVVTSGQADPLGGTTAFGLEDNSAVAAESTRPGEQTYVSGSPVLGVLWVQQGSGSFPSIGLSYNGAAAANAFDLNRSTGETQVRLGSFERITVASPVSGWWKVEFVHAGSAASTIRMIVWPAIGSTWPTTSVSATGTIVAYAPQLYLSHGRSRINGLSLRGVKLEQRADIVRATVEASGATFTFADIDGAWTAAFDTSPTATTWLASAMTPTSTTMVVKSTTGFPTAGTAWIDSETVSWTNKGAATFTGLTRGVWGSLAQSHYTPGGAFLRYPAVNNQPVLLDGRRVRLYLYGRGDSPTGDGTQVWLGVVRGEPRMEGPAWSLFCDPISSILDQELGADLSAPSPPRGIYLPSGFGPRFRVQKISYTSGSSTGIPQGLIGRGGASSTYGFDAERIITAIGFYESQEDFCEQVTSQMAVLTSGGFTTSTIQCLPHPDGYYYFAITAGANPDGITIQTRDKPDCEAFFPGQAQTTDRGWDPENFTATANTGDTYYVFPDPSRATDGAGAVPRGLFVHVTTGGASPPNVLYIGGASAITDNTDLVAIEWAGESGEFFYRIDSISTADRSVELDWTFVGTIPAQFQNYTPSSLPSIRFGRSYNSTRRPTGTYDLMDTLTDDAPTQVNTGAQPMIQSGDWDATVWLDAYTGLGDVAVNRKYTSLEPIKLIDLIAPDLQLAGLFLAFDKNGKLVPRRLRLASATEAATFQITPANLITDDGFPSFERGAVGVYSSLTLHEGYNAASDEYRYAPVTVRDVATHGQSPSSRNIKIEPKSKYAGGAVDYAEVVAIAATTLGVFARPYAYVTCVVPLTGLDDTGAPTGFDATSLGATVSITTAQLPSGTGTRGTTSSVGLVVSREIDLYAGRITLTILVSRSAIVGYAFGAKMTGVPTNTSGNTWEITVSSDYFVTGEDASDHVDSLDRVQVYRWNSATAGTVLGTVQSVSGNVVTVTFDGVWTPGSDAWSLAFTDADAGSDTDNMRRYAYQANSSGIIAWTVGGSSPARVFA